MASTRKHDTCGNGFNCFASKQNREEMANDIPSDAQALALGIIFSIIGYELLTTVPAGVGSTFTHNIGWAFIFGGVISLAAGILAIIRRLR